MPQILFSDGLISLSTNVIKIKFPSVILFHIVSHCFGNYFVMFVTQF